MNPKQVFLIDGRLYYLENGLYYPFSIIGAGGGGRGRKGDSGPPGPPFVIPSLTTAQREALVPTTALIVEDTDLDMYFKWSTVTSSWSPF